MKLLYKIKIHVSRSYILFENFTCLPMSKKCRKKENRKCIDILKKIAVERWWLQSNIMIPIDIS